MMAEVVAGSEMNLESFRQGICEWLLLPFVVMTNGAQLGHGYCNTDSLQVVN
jgi:hypothetical protein